jgi:hypothetical protein
MPHAPETRSGVNHMRAAIVGGHGIGGLSPLACAAELSSGKMIPRATRRQVRSPSTHSTATKPRSRVRRSPPTLRAESFGMGTRATANACSTPR